MMWSCPVCKSDEDTWGLPTYPHCSTSCRRIAFVDKLWPRIKKMEANIFADMVGKNMIPEETALLRAKDAVCLYYKITEEEYERQDATHQN